MLDLALLLVGLTATVAVAALADGLPADLRRLVVSAPPGATALALLQRMARRRGARALPSALLAFELTLLVLLVAALLVHARAGLAGLALPLAGALFALLALHLLAVLPRLRPLVTQAADRNRLTAIPSAIFFLLPLAVYLAWAPWATARRPPDGDEPWYLLVTHSLAEDFDLDLADEYRDERWRAFLTRPIEPQPGDPTGPDGAVYSRHGALLPLVLAPSYRLAGFAGVVVTLTVITAAVPWLFLRLLARWPAVSPRGALRAWALLAFAPPLLLYSHQVWVEVPAALLLLAALDRALDLRDGDRSPLSWVGLGVLLLLLPLLKLRFLLLALPLGVLLLFDRRAADGTTPRWRLLLPVIALSLGVLTLLLVNTARFGNPLGIHQWSELALDRLSPLPLLLRAWGLLWDPAFGLIASAPLWLVVAFGLRPLWRRSRSTLLAGAVLVAPYLLMLCTRQEWYGGWSPPFRYGLVVLPMIAVLAAFALGRLRTAGRRALVLVLLFATLALSILFMVEPGWSYHLAHGRTDLSDALSARTGLDFARLLPSAVRPQPATWQVPLAVLLLAAVAWRLPFRASATTPTLAAVLGALLTIAVLATTAALPTRTIDPEQPWVRKSGGGPEPPPWVFDRLRFRESWVLPEGHRLDAPVIPGGARVELGLELRFIENRAGNSHLRLRADDHLLAELVLDRPEEWQSPVLGPVDWPPHARSLRLELLPAPEGERQSGVALDSISLEWHPR